MPVSCRELSRRRQASAGGASASPAPTRLGVGSFELQRRDESSKQEMVTRRREQPNDLQLSSRKEKKKKVSNNRQIVAGLPEGEVSEVVLGAGHKLAEGLLCPQEVSPHRLNSD